MKVLWLWHTAGSGFIIRPEGHAEAGQLIPDNHLMSGLVFGKSYRLALVLQVALTKSCLGRDMSFSNLKLQIPPNAGKLKVGNPNAIRFLDHDTDFGLPPGCEAHGLVTPHVEMCNW